MDIEPSSQEIQKSNFSEKITPEFVQISAVGLGEIILNFLQNHLPLNPVIEIILTIFQVFLFIGIPLALSEINRKRKIEFLLPAQETANPALSTEPPKLLPEPTESVQMLKNSLEEPDSPEEPVDPDQEQAAPAAKGEQK